MPLSSKSIISEVDYLASEKEGVDKHEYYKGEVFAMSGASIAHNKITRNLIVSLANRLKGKGCEPMGSDLRIHIPTNTLYTYPDVSIFCGEIEKAKTDFDTATNPKVIIEVLSESTKDYDRGTKFALYREISSLQEYITVDSNAHLVEIWTRNPDNTWLLRAYKDVNDTLYIQSLGISIPITDIYG